MITIAALAVVTVSVAVLSRPRIGKRRLGPAAAVSSGVIILAAAGLVDGADVPRAFIALGPAMLAIGALMVMSAACVRLGALDLVADVVERRVGSSTFVLFVVVFAGSWLTAGALNNDAAVLVGASLVASLLRRRFAVHATVAEPFLLAVFLGAGVAPLATSNPMNLAFSHLAHVGFIEYARIMAPVSLVGGVVTLAGLLLLYRRRLTGVASSAASAIQQAPPDSHARLGVFIIVAVLAAYVPAALWSLPSWPVTVAGALVAVALVRQKCSAHATRVMVTEGVSVEILAVLPLVYVFAAALERSGLVAALAPHVVHQGALQVGFVSAVGSALLNNHTMALINVNLLVDAGVGMKEVLAAMIGGDLGPRLLPFGSLAGLLWLDSIRRQGFDVPLRRFVLVGFLTGVPSLIASLVALRLS